MGGTSFFFLYLVSSATDPKRQLSSSDIVSDFGHKHNVYTLYLSHQMVVLKFNVLIFLLKFNVHAIKFLKFCITGLNIPL